ncbi:uncharacterized protein V6R79_007564 [Siganus canaliculatus]
MERINKMKQLLDPSNHLFGQVCSLMVEQLEELYLMIQPYLEMHEKSVSSILQPQEQSDRPPEEIKAFSTKMESVEKHDVQIGELKQQIQELQQRDGIREEKIRELTQQIQELTKENDVYRKQHKEIHKGKETTEGNIKKPSPDNQMNQQKIKDVCEKQDTTVEEKNEPTSMQKSPSQCQSPSNSPTLPGSPSIMHSSSDSDIPALSGSYSSSDSDSPALSEVDTDVHVKEKKMRKGRQERPADRHLQDQLDDLRGLVEHVMQSLPSQLSATSQTKEEEGENTQCEQKSEPALDEKSKEIDNKLTVIIDQYDHLKNTVQSLVKFQNETEAHSPEKLELERNVQETILQLQHECTKLADIAGLYKSQIIALENEQRAQKLQTDQRTQQLSTMFHEVLNKVTSQEKTWSKVIQKLSTEMDEKLNRPELRQVENRWRRILKKLQSEKGPEKKSATVVKRYLSNRFRCLACDQDVQSQPDLRPFTIKILEKVQQKYQIRKPEMRSTQKNDVSLPKDKKGVKDLLEIEKSKAIKDFCTANNHSESSAGGYTKTSSRKVPMVMAPTAPFKLSGTTFNRTGHYGGIFKEIKYPSTMSFGKQKKDALSWVIPKPLPNPLRDCLVATQKPLHHRPPRLLQREQLDPNIIKP